MKEYLLDSETLNYGRVLHVAGAILAMTLAMIAYTCIYVPIVYKTDNLHVESKRLARVLRDASVVRKEHQQLRARLADVSDRIKHLRSRVPEKVMVSEFVSQVTEVAENEGVTISNIDTGRPTEREGFSEREIEFTGSGQYESFCRFVDRVRKLPRLSKVTGFEVHSETTGQEILPIKLRTSIYFSLDASVLKQKKDPSDG